ncbi:MAG: hypothetical protein QM727_10805 [Niabella sp.]
MAIFLNKWLMVPMLAFYLLFSGNSGAVRHPYHVSATEMEYNAKEKQIEVSCKLFADDFEDVLTKLYKATSDFSNPALKNEMTALVKRYLTTHLSVRSEGRLLPLEVMGWEMDREAVYVYALARADYLKNVVIENTILYDLFDGQANIVHFVYQGKRTSHKLNYPERKWAPGI